MTTKSTSQMTLEERREYIAKLRTERQERFGSAPSSRPSSSHSSRGDDLRLSPTKEMRRSDLQSTSPTPYNQPHATSLLGMHSTFQGSSLPPRSTSPIPQRATSPLPQRSTSPIPPPSRQSSTFSSSLPSSLATPLVAPPITLNDNTFLSSQPYETRSSAAFSSSFSVPPPDMKASAVDTKQAVNSAQRGYNQWAEEKLKWWDAEGKRLQTFLSQMDDEWDRHREATRRELEDEIAALKHESLVRSNINQASKNLL
eukprot:Phypoly_transcript_13276.p1 GENE.Phypoly_transcript_13276~~Phypoly_transcript_13276.p1  ORF type:complete len:256 (+),score=62.14 Phypoly_transcript_13276:184-951(+)